MGLNPAVGYFVPIIQVCVPVMAVSEVGPVISEQNVQWQSLHVWMQTQHLSIYPLRTQSCQRNTTIGHSVVV